MRKKICFVVPTHDSYIIGGAQYQVKLIIDNLLQEETLYEIHYITEKFKSGTKVPYQIHILNSSLVKKFGEISNLFNLYSLLRQIDPDIIYQRVAGAYTGICAYYCKRNGKKMVFHIAHEADVNLPEQGKQIKVKKLDAFIKNYGIRNTSIIIAQTTNQAQLLKKYFFRSPELIVYNFHLLPQNKPQYIIRSQTKICWIANIKPFKRPELFVELTRALGVKQNTKFLVMGKIMGSTDYQQKFNRTFLEATNLHYLGELSIDDVNKELTDCNLLVNTSVAEGFSNTFIQAWMRGVPVYSLNANPDFLFDKYPILGKCFDNNFEALKEAVSHFSNVSESTFRDIQLLAADLFSISNCKKIIDLFNQ